MRAPFREFRPAAANLTPGLAAAPDATRTAEHGTRRGPAGPYTLSTSTAMPIPPLTHSVAMP